MAPISWLDLAPEIRCAVYKHLFQSVQIEIHGKHTKRREEHVRNNNTSILLTCKLVNSEADLYFFAESEFILRDCVCWRKNPETRPPRLKDIQYLTFETAASEAYWISLWYDLILPGGNVTSAISNIKRLKITDVCGLEELGMLQTKELCRQIDGWLTIIDTLLWLFDCVKGRFQHLEILVDLSDTGAEEVGSHSAFALMRAQGFHHGLPLTILQDCCSIIVNEKHHVTMKSKYKEDLLEIKASLIEGTETVSEENLTLIRGDKEYVPGGEDAPDNEDEDEDY